VRRREEGGRRDGVREEKGRESEYESPMKSSLEHISPS
jgi:hypothetical protein